MLPINSRRRRLLNQATHSTVAAAKSSLRAIAQRWLMLNMELTQHDAQFEMLTAARAPDLIKVHGMATGIAAEMLLLLRANPQRIHSAAAFGKLCGACPIPTSSGKTNRHRRGGNRQANAALYRVVIVSMRAHQPTLDYVRRRTGEGKGKSEIIRCLKRYVVREIFSYLCMPPKQAIMPSVTP
jgi:transposase